MKIFLGYLNIFQVHDIEHKPASAEDAGEEKVSHIHMHIWTTEAAGKPSIDA